MLVQLRRMGHQIYVLEENRKLPTARRFTADFEQPGDGIATFWYNPRRGLERLLTWPWDRYYRKAFDGRNLGHRTWVVTAAAQHFKPDIIITSDGFSYAVPAAHARRLGWLRVPLVVGFIGGDILDCPEAEVGRRRTPAVTRLIRSTLATADALRPVSPKVDHALAAEGVNPKNLRMIPSHLVLDTAITDGVFTQRKQWGQDIRVRHGIPADAPLVVTLSGNQKGKGLHILARAWPRILERHPTAYWLLCGPNEPWLEQAVWPELRRMGAADSVIAAGALAGTAVFEYLTAADLHINPSLCESLNMVTVEAAAVGTPTITGDGAGISDWVARLGAGAVVPSGEAAPLADAIIAALADPTKCAAWSAAGRALSADFTLECIAKQLIELFESTLMEH